MSRHAIVTDADGYKVDFVVARLTATEDGTEEYTPLHYIMQTGERLIFEDISHAICMVKPRWTGKGWKETATDEEIEAARPEVEEYEPAPNVYALAAQNLMLMEAVAEQYEQNLRLEAQNLTVMEAIAELYEGLQEVKR